MNKFLDNAFEQFIEFMNGLTIILIKTIIVIVCLFITIAFIVGTIKIVDWLTLF